MDNQYSKYLKEQIDLYKTHSRKKNKGMSFVF